MACSKGNRGSGGNTCRRRAVGRFSVLRNHTWPPDQIRDRSVASQISHVANVQQRSICSTEVSCTFRTVVAQGLPLFRRVTSIEHALSRLMVANDLARSGPFLLPGGSTPRPCGAKCVIVMRKAILHASFHWLGPKLHE